MAKTKKQFNKEYYEKHKKDILEKRKQYRAEHGQKQYPKPEYWKRWYSKNWALHRAKRRIVDRRFESRMLAVQRLLRFIDNHPLIDGAYLEKIERWIRLNEQSQTIREYENYGTYQNQVVCGISGE
jgi:hypothetical protein